MFYEQGSGIAVNLDKAIVWYTKAAEQGHSGAQNNLAMCYHDGVGVSVDEDRAIEWYTKAARQGHEGAITELKENNITWLDNT
jgi:uncharacterized protein